MTDSAAPDPAVSDPAADPVASEPAAAEPAGSDAAGSDSEPAPTRLTLVRHGESVVTVKRILGGWRTCRGLSELGVRQAERLADRLRAEEFAADVLISSSFARARETAELIAPAFDMTVSDIVEDAGFGEHDPGPECDGMTFAEFVDTYGMPNWGGDPHGEIFPGGETLAAFHHRVGTTLASTLREHAGSSIVVACHGGVIDAAMRSLMRLPIVGSFELHTLNTAITEFKPGRPPQWALVRYNDASHLHGLPAQTERVP